MEIEQQVQTQQQKEQQKPRFEIKQYNALAFWLRQDGVEKVCGICKSELLDLCTDCLTNTQTQAALDCKAVEGGCSHQFHEHCIQRWTAKKNLNCPFCNSNWSVNKVLGR